ncbi:MAG: type IV secretory system conjugative DNA transfer family protein [Bacteroidota bacterium]
MSLLSKFTHLGISLAEKLDHFYATTFGKYTHTITNSPFQGRFTSPYQLLSKLSTGFCLTGRHSLSAHHSFQNAVIIGGTGTGKTSTVLLPSLFKMQGSFVVHDPSGELYHKSAGYLKAKGYTVKILNFSDASRSDRYNPLERATTASAINKVAAMIVRTNLGTDGEAFWNLQAVNLISLMIHLVKASEVVDKSLAVVRINLLYLSADPKKVEQKVNRLLPSDKVAEFQSFRGFDEKVKAGIIATCLSSLQIFTDPEVSAITREDSINLPSWRKQPTVLYIQNPTADQAYYASLTALFFEQMFGQVLRTLPKRGEENLFFLVDEAATLYIPSLAIVIANVRKYRCGLLLALQDMAQLIERYGQADARTIVSNCFAKLYFTGQSLATATELEPERGFRGLVKNIIRDALLEVFY